MTDFGIRQRLSIIVPGQTQAIANVGRQIEDFLAAHENFAPDQIIVLSAGANDLLQAALAGSDDDAGAMIGGVANLQQHLRTLDAQRARCVLVRNLIDVSDASFCCR